MPSFSTLILATAAITLSAAAPAPYTECTAPAQWYTCAKNNYAGCCTVDPCNRDGTCPDIHPQPQPTPAQSTTLTPSTTPTPSTTQTPSVTPSSCPAPQPETPPSEPAQPPPPSASCPPEKQFFDYHPTFWTFWRDEPQRGGFASNTPFSVSQSDNRTNKVNQVLAFNINPNATHCSIGWYQPAHAPGFKVENTGFTPIYQLVLKGLPWDQAISPNGENPNWENLKPLLPRGLEPGTKLGTADFTNWDNGDVEGHHRVGTVECFSSSIAFLADLDGGNGKEGMHGSVDMPQSEKAGWYVSYCVED